MKIPAAKAAVDREWEKLQKISPWNLTKVRSKKEMIDEARTKGARVHFASLMDMCHLKNAELLAKAPKIQRSSCTSRRYCERWFWILCSTYRTRIISITNDCSKHNGYHIQIARMLRTSSWRSICLYPGQNGRCTDVIENSKVRMSRYLDTSTTTQMAQIMVQYGRPSRSSWAKLVRSSLSRTIMETTYVRIKNCCRGKRKIDRNKSHRETWCRNDVFRSYDMGGHAKKCVERNCEFANKPTEQFFKVATPCFDDHHL